MSAPRPRADSFYESLPGSTVPGAVLRTRRVPITLEGSELLARQVVHASTGSRGQPIEVSGTVLVPTTPWAGAGARPVLTFGVGVRGLGRDTAPSYLMRVGNEPEAALIAQALSRGWAVTVTDGEGLGMAGPHTYGAGRSGGHAMIDIVRAARRLDRDVAADGPVVAWGYSEGGRNAAWVAELQPTYAPDLDLRAVAAGGVPADLRAVATAIDGGPFSGLGLAVLVGLAHAHQDPALFAILSDAGKAVAARAATRDAVALIVDYPQPMRAHTVRDEPWDEPVWRALLDREKNGRGKPQAPMYLYHVNDDALVPTSVGRELFADYVAAGVDVTWVDVDAPEHLSGGFMAAPGALDWLAARLVA